MGAPVKRKSRTELESEAKAKSKFKEPQNLIDMNKLESPVKQNNQSSSKSQLNKMELKEKIPEFNTPLNIEELASKSAQILSSLSNISLPKQESSSLAPGQSSGAEEKQETFGLQKTDFFVFLDKLPFGVFEEDL